MTLLPIGSVVLLNEAEKKLMIIGILQRNGEEEVFDYVGCPYPEGLLDSENLFLFNHKDIAEISYLGFDNIERQIFIKKLETELNKNEE